jgi:FAD/FMN-containing dehydrogenase
MPTPTAISGWGRVPVVESDVIAPETLEAARLATAAGDGLIPRGNGRAYGDAAIGARQTLDLTPLNRMQSFDPASGRLTVEAGVLLSDIIAAFGPRGFFPPVVPGTRFVTVGGAIAADIHGKNHHRDGGFGEFVESIRIALSGGDAIDASRQTHANIFHATIGGMGLTGTILQATLRLRAIETGWIRQQTIVARDLASVLAALDAHDASTYSVAWIDSSARGSALGRALVYLGEHASLNELTPRESVRKFPAIDDPRLAVPIDLPSFTLNRLSVAAFNELYFRKGAWSAGAPFLIPVAPYFFPLDGVSEWNRIYGGRGFVQHQCVLPLTTGPAALGAILERIPARGDASFLTVLKKLGAGSGLLSFPMRGYTLALDFPMSPGLPAFLQELDRLVVSAGGRMYLAKDAHQSRETFDAGYPSADAFRALRREIDPHGRLRSRLSDRLGL